MATIAEQLTSLANTKTAIKQAIIDKGVSVADDTPFSGYATKIGEIQGCSSTKFGASIDTFFGDVVDGVLQNTTAQTALNFAGITEIGNNALQYTFYGNPSIISVDFGSLQTVRNSGLSSTFYSCLNLTSVDLSSLQSVDSTGLQNAFRGCSNITGALDLSSLQSVGFSGLNYAFSNCAMLTSVDLSSLTTVGAGGLKYAFGSCKGLTTISFPSLTSVQTNSFDNTFNSCTNLTEIHFRADMQATIEAMTGYDKKWGATNATIYFDL